MALYCPDCQQNSLTKFVLALLTLCSIFFMFTTNVFYNGTQRPKYFSAKTITHAIRPQFNNSNRSGAVTYFSKLDYSYSLLAKTSLSGANPALIAANVSQPDKEMTSHEILVERENARRQKDAGGRRDSCEGCFRRPYTYLLNAPDACMDLGPERTNPIDLLVLVTTHAKNRQKRHALRKTWLSLAKYNTDLQFRFVFLLGYENHESFKALEYENGMYFDMVMQNFKDSYRNLTLKTLMGLQWAGQYCTSARYVMKTDDDMFVNTTNVVRLTKQPFMDRVVFGMCLVKAGPIRDRKSKWYASMVEYPSTTYPGFCSGTGYVMSRAVATGIVRVSVNVPFFYLEDVYISLCVKELGYELRNIRGFHNYAVPFSWQGCGMYASPDLYTSHQVSPERLFYIWANCGKKERVENMPLS